MLGVPDSSSLSSEIKILKSVIANLGEGVIVADPHGGFIYFNRVAEEILGIGAVDGALEHWSDVYGCYRPDKVTLFLASDLPLARALCGGARVHG